MWHVDRVNAEILNDLKATVAASHDEKKGEQSSPEKLDDVMIIVGIEG